jgi:nucleolar MIF4G domain-containing protein 1
MIEALTNLKNNKIKPTADGAIDNYSQLKKFLTSLRKTSGSTPEALRLTLADIRSSSSKGKWWIVGAAWNGDPLVDAKANGTLSGAKDKEVESDESLMKLAKTQGMNTDIRKSVFVVLMSSEVSRDPLLSICIHADLRSMHIL